MDTADVLLAVTLLLAGIVHLVPARAAFAPGRLASLYGMPPAQPEAVLLLRHRAALFGMLGAVLIAAALLPAWRVPAAIAGLASMLSFVALAHAVRTPALRKVMAIDLGLGLALGAALALRLLRG